MKFGLKIILCVQKQSVNLKQKHIYLCVCSHTHTHTGPSSDLQWDSRDQHCVATAVSQRGQVTLLPPSPRPSPRERPRVKPTHTGILRPVSSLPSCRCQAEHEVFWAQSRHTSTSSWKIHILERGSTACGCQTETCSQEMRGSATTALSFNHQQHNKKKL